MVVLNVGESDNGLFGGIVVIINGGILVSDWGYGGRIRAGFDMDIADDSR